MLGMDGCVPHQARACRQQHYQVRLLLDKLCHCLSSLILVGMTLSNCSCVLVIELCGIVCEAVAFNQYRPMLELIDLVEVVLSYLQTIHVALSKTTSAVARALFALSVEIPPWTKLSEYRFSDSAFREIALDESYCQTPGRQTDSYGINMAQAVEDVQAAIARVAEQCHASSDERLRSLTTASL